MILPFSWKNKVSFFNHSILLQRMFTWDFILNEPKFFQFGVWSISYNCLHEIPRNKTHCRCHFISLILPEMKFNSVGKCYVNNTSKWIHTKKNIWPCVYKEIVVMEIQLQSKNYISVFPNEVTNIKLEKDKNIVESGE